MDLPQFFIPSFLLLGAFGQSQTVTINQRTSDQCKIIAVRKNNLIITRLKLLLLLLATAIQFQAQAQLFVGYLDLDYSKLNYNDPRQLVPKAVYPCFVYDSSRWRVYNSHDYNTAAYQKKYNLYFKGKQLHSIYVSGRYDTLGWNVLDVTQSRIPKAGEKVYDYHLYENLKTRPPLLTVNKYVRSQPNKITSKEPGEEVAAQVATWLEDKAKELQLGTIPRYAPLVDKIKNYWQINDSVQVIETDLNLRLYCILDGVPFANSDQYKWDAIEKIANDIPTDGQKLYTDSAGNILRKWKTDKCFFLRTGNKIQYINRLLHFIDQVDLDADGYDELIFRKQGSSYISYVLLTNKFKTLLEHRVIQWW